MSCDMNMAANSTSKAPFPQNPAPAWDALAATEESLEAESDVGEVTSSWETTGRPSSGDGDQVQCPSRNRSISCSSNADGVHDLEAISNTLSSEESPANFEECLGKSTELVFPSHTTNTATNLSHVLQSKHGRTFSSTSSNSPWGADSSWGLYQIPEEFDEQGRMTKWTTAVVQKVKPYVPEGHQGRNSGTGILDTADPTHYYLTMPLGSLDTAPEVPEDIEEQRRMYSEATRIDRSPDDHTGLTDIESSDDSGDDGSDEDEIDTPHENDLNTGLSEAAAVPLPTYGGLWHTPVLRDVRESRFSSRGISSQGFSSQDVIYTKICTDDTGSVFSWTSDEDELEAANTQAHDALVKSKDKCYPGAEEVQAHNNRSRVLVTTTDGGTVRIDLPGKIVISYPGKPTNEVPFSIFNLSKTCWDIIKGHGIANVRAIHPKKSIDEPSTTSALPAFDSMWIQTNATFAMKKEFPDFEYYEDIQATCDQNDFALTSKDLFFLYDNLSDLPAHYLLNKPLAQPNGNLEKQMANGTMVPLDESNLTIPQFIKRLYVDSRLVPEQIRAVMATMGPNVLIIPPRVSAIEDAAAMADDWPVTERVMVPKPFDHDNGYYDLQQFNWIGNVGLSPGRVREERDSRYVEYRSLTRQITHNDPRLIESYNLAHFVPKAMYTKHKASTPHKQLRNLMACKSYNAVVYASDRGPDRSKVFHYHPFHDMRECIIDLSRTSNETVYAEPVRISTVALSTGDYYRGICMVGGFDGEYALRNMLHDTEDRSVVVGHATRATYGIVNHIDIDYFAYNDYRAVMACNDNKVRILDVETNTFLSDPGSSTNTAVRSGELSGHYYPFAVNCTAMCPDGKLRALVGDTTDVWVVDAENGQHERLLTGHQDYGFACAWSPDGRYIATANQDRLVKIWDARTWRVVTEFAANVAGYRSMRFSPVGGGSKCLLLAEPADRVCVVNATDYEQMQTHDFYGEIVGMDFHADGTGFWVANGDEKFGGMMEYERRGYGQKFGMGFLNKRAIEEAGGVYREQGANEWVWEREREEDQRVVDPTRTGPAGNWEANGLD